MKNLVILKNRLALIIMALLTSVYTYAQDGAAKVDVDITKSSGENWYNNPILWVVGIAVFILLFVAILRGGDRRTDA
ncbi:MAG TPA: hypothetical protein VEB40_01660 [Flavipsychrobacter sp.]|nr:hypothetical protein [Flavipsychrobacter sp.]